MSGAGIEDPQIVDVLTPCTKRVVTVDQTHKVTTAIETNTLFYWDLKIDDLKTYVVNENLEKTLVKTPRIELIEKCFNSNNHAFWRAIAQNPHTPKSILKDLSEVKGVKFAKQIKAFALKNWRVSNLMM